MAELRLCVDYRKVNRILVPNSYHLPWIGDLLERVRSVKVFTKLDLGCVCIT